VADRSGIIQKLEDKVAAALRDYNLTAAAGSTPAEQSAMAEYNWLVQNTSSSLTPIAIGIKYLALHSVAVKQGFYVDKRDQQEMLGTVAQEMGNLSPGEVLAGIQHLKSNCPAIYRCDAVAIDRMESNVVDFMTRLPINQQDRAVAAAKDTQLSTRLIEPLESAIGNTISPQIPTTESFRDEAPIYNSVHSQASPFHPVQSQSQINPPNQSNSKNALIISSGIVAGAMILSMAFFSSKNSQQSQVSIPTQKDNTVIAASSTPKSEVPTVGKKPVQESSSARQLYAVDDVASNDVLWIHAGPGVKTANIGSIPYNGQNVEALGEGVIVKTSL
jgi:hypothetical protein